MAAPLERVPENILMGQFVNGLRDEVRAEVRVLSPLNLDQAINFTIRVEDKNRALQNRKYGFGSSKSGNSLSSTLLSAHNTHDTSMGSSRNWGSNASDTQSTVSFAKSALVSSPRRNLGEVKRLTDKELQEKRSKELCFRCDNKWSMGHRCKKRELSVLLMDDEEDGESDGGSTEPPSSPMVEIVTEVSLNSVIGLSNPKTMKLRGLIREKDVVVLIDPGATHNFISLAVVSELGMEVTNSGTFGVSLGNGEAVKGMGVCKGVSLHLEGGVEVNEDFLPLALGNSDVILGV